MESALLGWAAGWLQACFLDLRPSAQKMSESTLGCDPASNSGLTELKCHRVLQAEGLFAYGKAIAKSFSITGCYSQSGDYWHFEWDSSLLAGCPPSYTLQDV